MIFMCRIVVYCSLLCLIFNLEEHQVHRDVELQLNGGDLEWIVGCLCYNYYIIHEKQLKSTCHALSEVYLSVGPLSSSLAVLKRYSATSLWVLRPRRTLITHHCVYTFISQCESLSFAGLAARRVSS